MAKTVNGAFNTFIQDYVNLDKELVRKARISRDNLLSNIKEFDEKDKFFTLYPVIDIQFGSFSRRTKCRPLDDIDLMIGISGDGATYNGNDNWKNIHINASNNNKGQYDCMNSDGTLNSTKVLNRFEKELKKLPEYQHSEIKKDHEAIVLNLISKDWSFDIVPCFITKLDENDKTYYLIPNGKGTWEKTDPRIDRQRVKDLSEKHGGIMLNTIRLFKYWNKYANIVTIEGYVTECLLLDFFEKYSDLDTEIKNVFYDLLVYVKKNIYYVIQDPKGIQGNINYLSLEEKNNINKKVSDVINKANEALQAEIYENDMEKAINIWRSIFGDDFPKYE